MTSAATHLLAVRELSKSFGGLVVNDNISFSLTSGDRVALIGPNGAGKTTFVDLVTGNLAPSLGHVLLMGEDVTRLGVADRVRRGLVRTFQITRLFAGLTVAENVALAVMQRKGQTGHMFSLRMDAPDVRHEWCSLLEDLGIGHLAGHRITELSYGQQRLVEIAVGLALRPKVLLLDEPAAGVPHNETHRILDAINRLPAEIAVLMIDHDMDLVFRFAKRVIVLAQGRVIFEGAPAEVAANDDVRQAYLGSYGHARRTA